MSCLTERKSAKKRETEINKKIPTTNKNLENCKPFSIAQFSKELSDCSVLITFDPFGSSGDSLRWQTVTLCGTVQAVESHKKNLLWFAPLTIKRRFVR